MVLYYYSSLKDFGTSGSKNMHIQQVLAPEAIWLKKLTKNPILHLLYKVIYINIIVNKHLIILLILLIIHLKVIYIYFLNLLKIKFAYINQVQYTMLKN